MSATETSITAQRKLNVERAAGTVAWEVSEFDQGAAVMLIARIASVQFNAHFNAEQWAAFQGLVAGQQP